MFSTRRSVICVALLAFASGCSEGLGGFGGRETEPELYPVLTERGSITYRMIDPQDAPGPEDRPKAPSPQQGRAERLRVRQDNMEAEGASRRARQDPFARERRNFQADQDLQREIERAEHRQQQQLLQFQRDEERREREIARQLKRLEDEQRAQQRAFEIESAFRESQRQMQEIQRQHEINNAQFQESLRRPY